MLVVCGQPLLETYWQNLAESGGGEPFNPARKTNWNAPAITATNGILRKYSQTVSSASEGCVTDEF